MVFSSLFFLFFFLPLNLILYFSTNNKNLRNVLLVLFSLAFYAWGEPVWIVLLIFSASVDFIHGNIIEKNRGTIYAKLALSSSIIINLSLLGFFKYSGFALDNVNLLLNTDFSIRSYALPIGISFYTFQTMSYTIDVYRGEVAAQKSFIKFLMFVSLFHQLVAGPIVRYKDIATEIEDRTITLDKFNDGINRFIIGLGKKVIIANTAGELAAGYLDNSFNNLTVVGAWYGIFLFAIQIYFDFSGYSDMAIGLGRMFGFTYLENFNYPYISKSASEFWRRWHISLGSFFRDYLYIPLGGNRHHHLRNIIIVWFLTGLWHGANWNFILWGLFYGLLLLVEKVFLGKILEKIPAIFGHLYLIVITLIGWTLFYFTDLHVLGEFMSIMFGLSGHPLFETSQLIQLYNSLNFIILAIVCSTPIIKMNWVKKLNRMKYIPIKGLPRTALNMLIILASVSLLVGETYNPFLYFRF